jgi:hypothetical protein
MFENEIVKLKKHYENKKLSDYSWDIIKALKQYFGIAQAEKTENATTDFNNAFGEGGSGVNNWNIIFNEDGTATLTHNFSFNIKQEHLGLIPIIANEVPNIDSEF